VLVLSFPCGHGWFRPWSRLLRPLFCRFGWSKPRSSGARGSKNAFWGCVAGPRARVLAHPPRPSAVGFPQSGPKKRRGRQTFGVHAVFGRKRWKKSSLWTSWSTSSLLIIKARNDHGFGQKTGCKGTRQASPTNDPKDLFGPPSRAKQTHCRVPAARPLLFSGIRWGARSLDRCYFRGFENECWGLMTAKTYS